MAVKMLMRGAVLPGNSTVEMRDFEVPASPTSGARLRRAELYPEAWEYSFGDEFYDHIRENGIFYMGQSAAWQADRPSVPAPGVEQYRTPTGCELQALADKLKKKDGVGNAGTG